ncbi:hypothetical protein ACMFMF_007308 [Clarireedia jacksonii]
MLLCCHVSRSSILLVARQQMLLLDVAQRRTIIVEDEKDVGITRKGKSYFLLPPSPSPFPLLHVQLSGSTVLSVGIAVTRLSISMYHPATPAQGSNCPQHLPPKNTPHLQS